MFGEHDDHQREMPRVLGAVFVAATLGENRLAENFLQFVDLDDEGDLAAKTFGGGKKRRNGHGGTEYAGNRKRNTVKWKILQDDADFQITIPVEDSSNGAAATSLRFIPGGFNTPKLVDDRERSRTASAWS
jgi:hypothetical protein